jgi:hypothetical protein
VADVDLTFLPADKSNDPSATIRRSLEDHRKLNKDRTRPFLSTRNLNLLKRLLVKSSRSPRLYGITKISTRLYGLTSQKTVVFVVTVVISNVRHACVHVIIHTWLLSS